MNVYMYVPFHLDGDISDGDMDLGGGREAYGGEFHVCTHLCCVLDI